MLEVHRNEDFILTTISHLRRVMSAVASSKFWISTLHVSTHYTEDHRQFLSAVLQTPAFLFSSENVCLPQSSAVLVLRPAQTCASECVCVSPCPVVCNIGKTFHPGA